MRQEPITARGASTVVSRISGRLTPSTPSRKRTPSERTQSVLTPSWKPPRPASNASARATDSPKAARLNASAAQRASWRCSPGMASSTSPPASGTKTVKVSSTGAASPGSRRTPEDEEGEQQDGAAEDAHCVGAHQAGLEPAAAAGAAADRVGHAVHGAVDDADVDGS